MKYYLFIAHAPFCCCFLLLSRYSLYVCLILLVFTKNCFVRLITRLGIGEGKDAEYALFICVGKKVTFMLALFFLFAYLTIDLVALWDVYGFLCKLRSIIINKQLYLLFFIIINLCNSYGVWFVYFFFLREKSSMQIFHNWDDKLFEKKK